MRGMPPALEANIDPHDAVLVEVFASGAHVGVAKSSERNVRAT